MTTYTETQRNKARLRALKWVRLFNPQYFDGIVGAIEGTFDEGAFNTAVNAIDWMTDEERAWLKNYLKHCGTLYQPANVLEAAAGTGW